jgi:FkbM family methyltransferase
VDETQPPRVDLARSDAGYLYFRNFLDEHAASMARDALQSRVEGLFYELCQRVRPTIGLEIGAHEASFSKWLKEASPETRCLAFEANPHVFEKHANRLAGLGVEYLHLAIGSTNGPVELVIPTSVRHKGRRLSNRMASLSRHTEADSSEAVQVDSRRLDDFLTAGPDDRLVAWVDVEGATEIVLGSGPAVMARTSLVYIEVEREAKWEDQWLDVDVARYLAGLGFVPIARDTQRPHQYNVIFASAELAADPEVARLAVESYRDVPPRRRKG